MADLTIKVRWIGDAAKQGLSDLFDGLETLQGLAVQVAGSLGLKSVVSAMAEDERAVLRLQGTLKNLGVTADNVMPRLGDYFSRLGDRTEFSKGEITEAFNVLARSTQDVQGSLNNLNLTMDIAAGTGIDLKSAAELMGKAMEGQIRPLLALDPALARYLQELEGIEDPATRVRLAMEKVNAVFGGQEQENIKGMAASLTSLKNSIMELAETIGEKMHLDDLLKGVAIGLHGWAVAIREGISPLEAAKRIAEGLDVPKVAPTVGAGGGADAPMTWDEWMKSGEWRRSRIDESAFGSILPGPNNRQRGDQFSNLADLLKEINTEVGTDYTQRMKEADEKFAEAHRQQMRAIGEELKSGLIGAFDAATQGGKAFVDYLKGYIKRELFEFFAGTLANLAVPGAGGTVSTGLLGHIFGGTGQSYQGIGAQQQSMNLRAARLG